MSDEVEEYERSSWLSPSSWIKWVPTSMGFLREAEQRILQYFDDRMHKEYVYIQDKSKRLWTVKMNTDSENTPLVMIHGFGSGVGLWALNYDDLSQKRPLYAFDVLGFGRSSRPSFPTDPHLSEMEFVNSIEDWRKEMKLDKFILLGHSFGGYIATAYAIQHPENIKHLVLCDPWGFPERPHESGRQSSLPIWIKAIATLMKPFNLLAGLRAAGPWGPNLVAKFRPDLKRKFSHLFEDDTIFSYIYHCNAQTPSGETAFKNLSFAFGWAKNPMIKRINDLHSDVPVTFVNGSKSWLDKDIGHQIKYLRNDSYVEVQMIKGAGHHVYADRYQDFNDTVNEICDSVDNVEIDGANGQSNSEIDSDSAPVFDIYTNEEVSKSQADSNL